ncbi:MAG: MepB family protein [Defluviitaleaceae bacterium]|nr:MepB family protein [Defluviitaleaceae bacterium]
MWQENESTKYGAYRFRLNDLSMLFRISKITPTKVGQFVTLWKRNSDSGQIQPFDISDELDFFVICSCKDRDFGKFVFPRSVLLDKGIISENNIGGKRAMRVYPPWDKPTNKQAEKTQLWQLKYFSNITNARQIIRKGDTLPLLYHKEDNPC